MEVVAEGQLCASRLALLCLPAWCPEIAVLEKVAPLSLWVGGWMGPGLMHQPAAAIFSGHPQSIHTARPGVGCHKDSPVLLALSGQSPGLAVVVRRCPLWDEILPLVRECDFFRVLLTTKG